MRQMQELLGESAEQCRKYEVLMLALSTVY